MLLLTFLSEIVTYLLINWNFISQFLNSTVMYSKEHISISWIVRVLKLLLGRTQNLVFERDVETPVLPCKDGLCSVNMNCPRHQARMPHQILTMKQKRTENVNIIIKSKYQGSFKEIDITPWNTLKSVFSCDQLYWCFCMEIFLLVNTKAY